MLLKSKPGFAFTCMLKARNNHMTKSSQVLTSKRASDPLLLLLWMSYIKLTQRTVSPCFVNNSSVKKLEYAKASVRDTNETCLKVSKFVYVLRRAKAFMGIHIKSKSNWIYPELKVREDIWTVAALDPLWSRYAEIPPCDYGHIF